jgi:hypothetical protein
MKTAHYCLLTLRPDPERIDLLCVGAVAQDADGIWHVNAPGPESKLAIFGASHTMLGRMAANLVETLRNCTNLTAARLQLGLMRSALALHDFEGIFSYLDESDFARNMREILSESVLLSAPIPPQKPITHRVVRPRTRARLRKQFEALGIMAGKNEGLEDHKVVYNYPVSTRHGLKAEFALKNSVMHITETVDFDVSEESVRAKTYEAHAKCLVLQAALETFGSSIKRHIVVSGSASAHAARTIDLLSTVGQLYTTESNEDMDSYINTISLAAGNPVIPTR